MIFFDQACRPSLEAENRKGSAHHVNKKSETKSKKVKKDVDHKKRIGHYIFVGNGDLDMKRMTSISDLFHQDLALGGLNDAGFFHWTTHGNCQGEYIPEFRFIRVGSLSEMLSKLSNEKPFAKRGMFEIDENPVSEAMQEFESVRGFGGGVH
jgi:hypothetical protein